MPEGIGVATVAGGGAGVPDAGGGGTHWVQMVEVEVLVIVETVVITCTEVISPEVIVFVTGHVVTVVWILYAHKSRRYCYDSPDCLTLRW